MSLDVAAMRALVGEAQVSAETARLVLDETGARAEDVEAVELRPLWAVIEARVRERQPLDVVGIRHSLRDSGEACLAAALTVLLEPELGCGRERLALLRDAGIRRRLVEALRVVAVATKGGRPLGEVEVLLRAAPALMVSSLGRVRNASGDSIAHLNRLESAWAGRGVPRLRTGWAELDREVVLVNNLIAIGARTGVGKSAMVAGLVRGWLGQGLKVGVLAYEDDALDMEARIIACDAGVSLLQARGDLPSSEAQRANIGDALAAFAQVEHLLEVDDARPNGTPADVVASMRAMVRRGCRVVILDNMSCVRMDGPDDKRHDLLVGDALLAIRETAQALRVPAIVVGHLKRGEGRTDEATVPPRLSDFSNATAWENFARVALGMWRADNGVAMRVL